MSHDIDGRNGERLNQKVQPLAILLAVVAGLLRLVPHPWNLTPVGALGLYGGARLRTRYAFLLPLLVMLGTDAALIPIFAHKGYPSSVNLVTPFIYASFLINVLIGRLLTRTNSPVWIGGAALLGSIQFFVVTNFAVWLIGQGIPYPGNLAGLVECYVAGLPFFGNTLAGDLLYTGVFFGAHALVLRYAANWQAKEAS